MPEEIKLHPLASSYESVFLIWEVGIPVPGLPKKSNKEVKATMKTRGERVLG